MIIDVDTHWESTRYAAGEHPLEPWLDLMPRGADLLRFAIAGDLLHALPESRWPTSAELLPNLHRAAERKGGPVILHPLHDSTAAERVEWMDRIGIDHCLVNPGGFWQLLNFVPQAERAAGTQRCNAYLCEQLADRADRLHAVAAIDFHDLDEAVRELERARSRGARAFFLRTEYGRPANDLSPGHPDYDRVWAAATDLGMIAVIHVGNTSADFGGWADIGWERPGSGGAAALARLANSQRITVAQNLISALLYGGVFAGHPRLTVMIEECRVGWLPFFVQLLERQSQSSFALGDWPWEESGGDMLRRALRFTPLIGFGDTDAIDVVRELPTMGVFSSDYPHQEGNADPINVYGSALDDLDEPLRASFMGANVEECYSRMGQPLAA